MNVTLQFSDLPLRLRFEEPLSDCDLLKFCNENNPLRVERDSNGELILMSPNTPKGSSIEAEVLTDLMVWSRSDGRGKAFGPTAGFTLPDTSMRAPDASWITSIRWNALSEAQLDTYSPICPDFVIEVRSKSDRLKPLQEKMTMWIANGAELAWLVDPLRKVIEIYRLNESPEIHDNPTSVLGTGPVAGFELVLSRIWG